jgi:predicted Zn-dependent protease
MIHQRSRWIVAAGMLFFSAGCGSAMLRPESSDVIPENERITEEQEHALGVEVAARTLAVNAPFKTSFNAYATILARYLAGFSKRPVTFKGYRVTLVRGKDAAAFSAPGGMIFLSEGMLDALQSEEELAAVLAHEIAHVAHHDGVRAMRQRESVDRKIEATSRFLHLLDPLNALSRSGAPEDDAEDLSTFYDNHLGKGFGSLLKSGFSRDQERDADRVAIQILARAGYDGRALARFLSRTFSTAKRLVKAGEKEIGNQLLFPTHPFDEARARELDRLASEWIFQEAPEVRTSRFMEQLKAPRQ